MVQDAKSFMRYFTQRWVSCAGYKPPLEGCTLAELDLLMQAQKVKTLPALYTEYMLTMGKQDGGLSDDYYQESRYPNVMNFKKYSEFEMSLLKSIGTFTEPLFIFYAYPQADIILYFNTTEHNPDPMVFTTTFRPNRFRKGKPRKGLGINQKKLGTLSFVLVDILENFCGNYLLR